MAEALKKERSTNRGQLTKTINRFKERNQQNNVEGMRSDLEFAEALYSRMVELSGRYRAEANLADADYEKDVEKDLEYLQGLCIIRTQWQAYVDSQRKKEPPSAPTLPHKLDPIPVPEFTGDRAQFPFFWQAFKARIDLDDRFNGGRKTSAST